MKHLIRALLLLLAGLLIALIVLVVGPRPTDLLEMDDS
jgi:hypothetical protein